MQSYTAPLSLPNLQKKKVQTTPVLGMIVFLLDTVKGAEFNCWVCVGMKKLVLLAMEMGGGFDCHLGYMDCTVKEDSPSCGHSASPIIL